MNSHFDRELEGQSAEVRLAVWKSRIEAILFASPTPVTMEKMAKVVGERCPLLPLILEIERDAQGRPYELVEVGGGWQFRTRPEFAEVVRIAGVVDTLVPDLTPRQLTALVAIAYFQPITRNELGTILGRQVSRDLISSLARAGLIAPGARSPLPGAPYTYVTTPQFLIDFGFKSLRDLPDMEALTEAGLLSHRDLFNREDPLLDLQRALAGEAD